MREAAGERRGRRRLARAPRPPATRCARRSRWAPTGRCSSPTRRSPAPTSSSPLVLLAGGARAGERRPRPVRPAVGRRRRRLPLGGGRRAARRPVISQVAELTRRRRSGDRQAADRVRLRADPGAAAGGRRGLGRDQRAALPVAEGDHGREDEAAGGAARRPRSAGRRQRRGRPCSRSARRPSRGERRQDRGRRRRGRGDRRRSSWRSGCSDEDARLPRAPRRRRHEGRRSASSPRRRQLGGEVAASSPAPACGARGRGRAVRRGEGVRRRRRSASPRRCRSRASTCSRGSCGDEGFDTVLFAQSVLAADIAAGLAARLEAGLNWDLADLGEQDGELVGKRPALADSVWVDVGWDVDAAACRLPRRRVRPGRDRRHGRQSSTRSVELEEHSRPRGARRAGRRARRRGPSIEDADVIVAGGRGPRRARGLRARRGARRGARRRGRRDARRRRRRLVPVLGPGRPDRQDRLAEALRRARHLGRDPAQGRHAELGHDRRDQQGPERADLRVTAISASSATCTRSSRS